MYLRTRDARGRGEVGHEAVAAVVAVAAAVAAAAAVVDGDGGEEGAVVQARGARGAHVLCDDCTK